MNDEQEQKFDNLFVFTQARLNSQRLPRKMLKDMGGTTLWNLACRKLELLPIPKERKWVSVYEPELADIAAEYNISIYRRSCESANEDHDVSLIWEICRSEVGLSFPYYVLFNPCLPLLRMETIYKFITFFASSTNESVFGVKPLKDYLWDESGELFFPKGATMLNTKACQQLWLAAHALYAGRTEDIRNGIQMGDFSVGNPALYPLTDKIELLDIDDETDYDIARAVYNYYFYSEYL